MDRKEQRRLEAEQRQARSNENGGIQKRIAALEKEIADLEAEERDYVAELEKPETYHSGGRATQINRELCTSPTGWPRRRQNGKRRAPRTGEMEAD